jgi:acyl-CoA thioester hydrolase
MFELVITPRVSETDLAGHINNTTLPVWFEAARAPIFQLFHPRQDYRNWKMVIVKSTLEFKKQIYYGTNVVIRTWVKNIGNASLVLHEELYQEGSLCAVNEAVYVNFNLKTQEAEMIPLHIRNELLLHFYEDNDLRSLNGLN